MIIKERGSRRPRLHKFLHPGRLLCSVRLARVGFAFLILLAGRPVAAQQTHGSTDAVNEQDQRLEAPRVFLDCSDCDFSYVRREIPFVNHVREPHGADVHVLVTEQPTGGGGRSYRLAFLGRESFAGQEQRITHVTEPGTTEEARRKGLTQALQMGLLAYVAQTPARSRITISYAAPGVDEVEMAPRDAWDNWVFELGAGGSLETEESQRATELEGSFSADRVTPDWKIRTGVQFQYDEQRFERSERVIRSVRHDLEATAALVRSLGTRWSVGTFADAYSESSTNIAAAVRLSPGIEYNLFAWDLSDRKVLTVAYTAGVRSFSYVEQTIFGKGSETLAFESLRAEVRLTQPWGRLEADAEASHYFHDLGKRRLEVGTDLSFRISRGLSIFVGMDAESIHDQLYLPRGDASLEEILLQRRQLATTYELATSAGLRYTFGSLYNNVVNSRF